MYLDNSPLFLMLDKHSFYQDEREELNIITIKTQKFLLLLGIYSSSTRTSVDKINISCSKYVLALWIDRIDIFII